MWKEMKSVEIMTKYEICIVKSVRKKKKEGGKNWELVTRVFFFFIFDKFNKFDVETDFQNDGI